MQERLTDITHTIEGFEVKNLTWLPMDNVIRGQVKDPIRGKASLHDGFIVATWRKNGKLTAKYGGADRSDLDIHIDYGKR